MSPRGQRGSWISTHRVLALSMGIMFLLLIIPSRFTTFLNQFNNTVVVLVQPAQWLFSNIFTPVSRSRATGGQADQFKAELDLLKTRYYQVADDNRRLRSALEQLQRGLTLNPSLDAPRAMANVIGLPPAGSTLLQLRVDHIKSADPNQPAIGEGSVVVVDGVNLLGKIIRPGAFVAWAQPTIDKTASTITGIVLPPGTTPTASDPINTALSVKLQADGNGKLSGPVFDLATTPSQPIAPGMVVRLSDQTWPSFAQMLIVGTVESVSVANNGRKIVTVTPNYNLRSLDEVLILSQPSSSSSIFLPPAGKSGVGR
jgi:cell shape-determining protein MreC